MSTNNSSEKYFDALKSGNVKIDVQQKFTLEEVGKVHAAMSNRETVGMKSCYHVSLKWIQLERY